MSTLSNLYLQIAQLLDAGFSIPKTLQTILPQASKKYKPRLERVILLSEEGVTPSEAFRQAGFTRLELGLVQVAERTGDFPGCFRQIADYHARLEEFNRKLISGLTYPVLLIVIAPLILNIPTFFFSGLSAFLRATFAVYLSIIGVIAVMIIAHRALSNIPTYGQILQAIPVIGPLRFRFAFARFCYAASALLGGGIRVEHSLQLAAEATNDIIYQRQIEAVLPGIVEGNSIYEQLSQLTFVPPLFLEFVKTGEVSGTLPESLKKQGDMYMDEAGHRLSIIAKVFPGIVYGAVALMIAMKILAQYQNIYKF